MNIKPLFIPLKTEFYNAFVEGHKRTEYRRYGKRWNENTCMIGRQVVISKGYGKGHRYRGVIVEFERSSEPTQTKAWRTCYGDQCKDDAACITIQLLEQV